jgi:hypothetical protein
MWSIIAVLLIASAAHGGTACPGLASAKAEDLLALPGENPLAFEWLPGGVRCTSPAEEPRPGFCRWSTTITHDDTIAGERRLVIASAMASDGMRRDYVFVFACVGGRVRSVFHDRFQPGVELVEATRAKIVFQGSDQLESIVPRRNTFYWNDDLDAYTSSGPRRRTHPREEAARCDDIATVALRDLRLVNHVGFAIDHGMGCYAMDEEGNQCEWFLSLDVDRPIGANRRLIVVGRDHRGGVGWDGDVFVVSCTGGRVATVFAESYDRGASVPEASADSITVAAGGWNPGDAACCLSREDRFRYAWDGTLRGYVLRSVDSRSRTRRP